MGPQELPQIIAGFRVDGPVESVAPWGSGHIHDSYVGTAGGARYLHQRINTAVFPDPERLMENIARVTEHLRARIAAEGGDPRRGTLSIVPARDGGRYLRTPTGECWRTFRFIEGSRVLDEAPTPEHAFQAARAFGHYQRRLADLPPPPLHDLIPGFGDPAARLAQFRAALERDPAGRAAAAADEVAFVARREELVAETQARFDGLPRRVVHHDTKLNNVLLDAGTGEALCVIDLDTTTHGTPLYDFGDMVRLGASRAAEDETDLARVRIEPDLFEALVRGYVGAAREFLLDAELDGLIQAARVVPLVIGLRFLADFLQGDRYFKTARRDHNLDRCRTQFALVRDVERRSAELDAVVARHR